MFNDDEPGSGAAAPAGGDQPAGGETTQPGSGDADA